MKKLQRSGGLLLHPTSLPGPFGIGEIGENAYSWIDFLERSGQFVWQILPIGPTGYGNSPYQTTSVFAGNPLLIDLTELSKKGFISADELSQAPSFPDDAVDYNSVIDWKMPLLLEAYNKFNEKANDENRQKFKTFCAKHGQQWLDEFALFMALKSHYNGIAWNAWPAETKLRNPDALKEKTYQLEDKILAHKFIQYIFFEQWMALKKYANERGIQIMGDIPIYVTYDSADVWANQDKFYLNEEGNPTLVAGVPPDYFSETGQLWGNPIYDWEKMQENGFRWWIDRVNITLTYVDIVRIDHFRGFEAYWAVPYGEKTAQNGEWIKGPDHAFFDVLTREMGELPIVVEDLGVITPQVETLRDRYNFPGMKILQFAFSDDATNDYLPHNYDANCVVYTGSHDNDTTHGWFATIPDHEHEYCIQYLGKYPQDIAWELIRLASSSVALLAIFPLQDVLSLGTEARMNMPGQPNGNWTWRLKSDQLTDEHAKKLATMSQVYGRLNNPFQTKPAK